MFLITLLGVFFSVGDTYRITDDIKFRDKVLPFAGVSFEAPIDPVQVGAYFGMSNIMLQATGTFPTRSSHRFPIQGDVKVDSLSYWYAVYVGYVPGELMLEITDDEIIEIKPFASVGAGWAKKVVGYKRTQDPTYSGGSPIHEIFNVSTLNEWRLAARTKFGMMVDYRRIGVLVSIGQGYNYEVGLHYRMF